MPCVPFSASRRSAAPRLTAMTAPSRVRFIGFAIPTVPADQVPVGDPNGPGSLGGRYVALADRDADIAARVAVMLSAVRAAQAKIPAGETDVLNVFVAPEFFWHSPQGPYIIADGQADPADTALSQLSAAVAGPEFANWFFVFGSMITAAVADPDEIFARESTTVRNKVVYDLAQAYRQSYGNMAGKTFAMLEEFIQWCHGYPIVEVRNRALIVSGADLSSPGAQFQTRTATTEKYFDSAEDFLLWDVTGRADVITEQMTTYPHIDLTAGDFKKTPTDQYAIFRRGGADAEGTDIAVEICLDHSDNRVRRNIDHNPWPSRDDGIDLHLIPSCGMQIDPPSVAARAGGYVFNVDGQYRIGTADVGVGTVAGALCAYANHSSPADSAYQAHTQLARVQTAAVGGDWRAPDAANAVLGPMPEGLVTVIPVEAPADIDAVYAGGAGVVHIYGLDEPLPLPGVGVLPA